MPPDDDKNDPKVKDILDAASQADLERWFGLPSFEQLAETSQIAEPAVDDPEMVAARERRDRALACVEPALLESLHRRAEPEVIRFESTIELHVDPSIALVDLGMVDRAYVIAEPREVPIPEQLQDDLHDCTPQAILRDLHRPELDFEKTFEVVDYAAEQRMDIVAMVTEAMATSWKLPPLEGSPFREARGIFASFHAELRQSWAALLAAQPLPNRRFDREHDK
jgi:hypothetical protein